MWTALGISLLREQGNQCNNQITSLTQQQTPDTILQNAQEIGFLENSLFSKSQMSQSQVSPKTP